MREICEFGIDEKCATHHSSGRPSLLTLAAGRGALAALLLILLLLGIPCRSASASVSKDALFVYPGATKVAWVRGTAGSMRVNYLLHMKYPATRAIDWTRARLRNAGWKPSSYNFFYPHAAPSWDHLRKWFYHLAPGGPGSHMECMHGWTGDWKDASGDIATYVFVYVRHRNICSNSGLTNLQVIGIYIPAAAVPRLRREFMNLQKHQEQSMKENQR